MADIEETRAVVHANETFDGRIIPTQETDIQRPVRIREGVEVLGSVYGTGVSIDPGAVVDGSVMARDEIELTEARIQGELGAVGRAVCEGAEIGGTVTGKRVRLSGCVVRGNVVGTEVILEDCLVFGLVSADRKLVIEDSLCYSFRGVGEVTVDGAKTVLPQAVVGGALNLESPVTVVGLGALETPGDHTYPQLTAADRRESEDVAYLTLAPRLLNLGKVKARIEALEAGIISIVDDTSDEQADASIEALLAELGVDLAAILPDLEALE